MLKALGVRSWLFCIALVAIWSHIGYIDRLSNNEQGATRIFRVSPIGSDTPTCGSETAPCKTIQYAVNLAHSGDTILVAGSPQGVVYTYNPAADFCSSTFGTTGVVCIFQKQITILGGYSTSNWSVSDPASNLTIIDGENSYRGVFVLGYPSPETTGLDMEGFVIQNGKASPIPARQGDDSIFAFGGGMFVDTAQTVILRNLTFRRNRAIGADTSTAYGGAGSGGGMTFRGVRNGILEYIVFDSNQAIGGSGRDRGGYAVGGGFGIDNSIVIGRYITLTNNSAFAGDSNGSGVDTTGQRADALGGAGSLGGGSHVTLQYVTARNNSAFGGDAQMYAGGAFGGALKVEKGTLILRDADLRENLAQGGNAFHGYLGNGGGLEAMNSNVTIERTYIVNNIARGGNGGTNGSTGAAGGGGVNSSWTPGHPVAVLNMLNCVVADNLAEMGAGTYPSGGGGGGLWIQATQANIAHTTIARNRVGSAMDGQGVLLIEVGSQGANAILAFSIIAEHASSPYQAALHVKPGNTVRLQQGLFAGNTKDTNADNQPGPAGTFIGLDTMLHGQAHFVSPGSPNYNYHILGASSARDRATDSSLVADIDGDSRLLFSPPDIGADEYAPIVLTSIPVASGTLKLNWKTDTVVVKGVDHYELLVFCPPGANPPNGGDCPATFDQIHETSYVLSGLSNYKTYTMTVRAKDSSDGLIETSNTVTTFPTDIFVYLPGVFR
jgi:hypothetical protein